MNRRFNGKTALITGAAHGIGRAICVAFASLGAEVWACDILEDELSETQFACQKTGGSCTAKALDVTNTAQIAGVVEEAESAKGSVDILVSNAGGVLGQVGRPLEEVSPEDWNAIFAVNASGAFYMAQAIAPGMKKSGWGRIVNISSGAGLGVSLTGIQAYASAKAAQIGLTRQLAHELGSWGITVNNIAPGFVLSNPTTQQQWESYGETGQRELVERIAMKRLGQPEDIAAGVLFFASTEASWITGQVLSIDGGR